MTVDEIVEIAEYLESKGGDPAVALCALNKRFEGLCKLDILWQALCQVRDWDRADRLDWSRKKLKDGKHVTFKEHYRHWHGLVHDNRSISDVVTSRRVEIRKGALSPETPDPKYGPIEIGDTSRVTDMSGLFHVDETFEADISMWNTSNVETMRGMFFEAKAFNADISRWDVSKVSNMDSMFLSAAAFNADISTWVVSNVTNMEFMFHGATAFNADISGWVVSQVTNMELMFNGAEAFNADISGWKVAKGTNTNDILEGATAFQYGRQVNDKWRWHTPVL